MMALFGQFLERHPRPDDIGVGHDVLVRQLVHILLPRRRLPVADEPGARNVGAHAVAADQVGVEGEDFIIAENAWSALLEPGIGALPGGQDTGFDPFAAAPDIAFMQFGPDVVFGHARLRQLAHFGDRRLASMYRAAHRQNLVRPLNRAYTLHQLFAVHDFDAGFVQRTQTGDLDLVDRDPATGADAFP